MAGNGREQNKSRGLDKKELKMNKKRGNFHLPIIKV